MNQLDVFRHSDQAQAIAYREAALFALVNPYETPEQREKRAAYYEQQAKAIEQRSAQ